jgi:endonuclease YncB( thermonuclease family)
MAANRIAFIFSALLLCAGPLVADVVTGKVVGVSDGDTITVLDGNRVQHKIRVSGIDAPEKGQALGQRAKENLSLLVFGREVDVLWHKHDRYRRIVGKVMVAEPDCRMDICPKNFDAGLSQISAGLAWWYRKYAKEQSTGDASRYGSAEADAITRRAGLWFDAHPTPPWDWRKGRGGG